MKACGGLALAAALLPGAGCWGPEECSTNCWVPPIAGSGGVGGAGGASNGGTLGLDAGVERVALQWEPLTEIIGCRIEQVANTAQADALLSWEPCGGGDPCQVARPHFDDLGPGWGAITPGSSVNKTGALALTYELGGSAHALLTTADGSLTKAVRAADPQACSVVSTGLGDTEFGVAVSAESAPGIYSSAVLRFSSATGVLVSEVVLPPLPEDAAPLFLPRNMTDQGWLIQQAGGLAIWSIDRDGVVEQLVPAKTVEVVDRGEAQLHPDGRFVYSELVQPTDLASRHFVLRISDGVGPPVDLLTVPGQNWASPRWVGAELGVVRAYDPQGPANEFDRAEVWSGPVPSSGEFNPELLGELATGSGVLGEWSGSAIGGLGHYAIAMPGELGPSGIRSRAFKLWNLAAQQLHQLKQGEELSGFLGMSSTHVYLPVGYQGGTPRQIKRYRLVGS